MEGIYGKKFVAELGSAISNGRQMSFAFAANGGGLAGGSIAAAATTGAALLGAGVAGYQAGGVINEHVVNPLVRAATGDENTTLGGAIYDLTHR